MDEDRYEAFINEMDRCINEKIPMTETDVKNFIIGWIVDNSGDVDEYKTRWEKEHPEQVKLIKDNMLGSKPAG